MSKPSKEEFKKQFELSGRILDLVRDHEGIDNGDLQGISEAIIMQAIEFGRNSLKQDQEILETVMIKQGEVIKEMKEVLKMIVQYDETTPMRQPYTTEIHKPLTNLLREKAKNVLKKVGE